MTLNELQMINFLMISLVMNKLFNISPSTYNILGDFMYKSIKAKELFSISEPNIIDVRSKSLFNNNHISNAINIPFDELLSNYKKYLNKGSIYYIYCQRGNKSRLLCSILNNYGYDVVNIKDGYDGIDK